MGGRASDLVQGMCRSILRRSRAGQSQRAAPQLRIRLRHHRELHCAHRTIRRRIGRERSHSASAFKSLGTCSVTPLPTPKTPFNTFGCVYFQGGGMHELARKVTLMCVGARGYVCLAVAWAQRAVYAWVTVRDSWFFARTPNCNVQTAQSKKIHTQTCSHNHFVCRVNPSALPTLLPSPDPREPHILISRALVAERHSISLESEIKRLSNSKSNVLTPASNVPCAPYTLLNPRPCALNSRTTNSPRGLKKRTTFSGIVLTTSMRS